MASEIVIRLVFVAEGKNVGVAVVGVLAVIGVKPSITVTVPDGVPLPAETAELIEIPNVALATPAVLARTDVFAAEIPIETGACVTVSVDGGAVTV